MIEEFPVKILTKREFSSLFSQLNIIAINKKQHEKHISEQKPEKKEERIEGPVIFSAKKDQDSSRKEKLEYYGVTMLKPDIVRHLIFGNKVSTQLEDKTINSNRETKHILN